MLYYYYDVGIRIGCKMYLMRQDLMQITYIKGTGYQRRDSSI